MSAAPLRFALVQILLTLLACKPQTPTDTLFETIPPASSGIDFRNDIQEDERFNIIQYLYFYNGAGVAVGDIDADGLPDLFFVANQQPNRLYRNLGNFRFEDITERAGLLDDDASGRRWKTGVTMADVNGDGQLDIFVCEIGPYKHIDGRNRLYINLGNGSFEEKAADFGLDIPGYNQHATFFDMDLDGDLDCFLLRHSVHSTASYAPAERRQLRDSLAGDLLLRNDGGRFIDITQQAGIYGGAMSYGLSAIATDLNGDGWPDIYVGNDFHENDYLYLNNGNGTFTEAIATAMPHTSAFTMGTDAADINNDGLIDLFSLDMKPWDIAILKASAGADPWNLYAAKLGVGYHYQFPRNALQIQLGRSPTNPPRPRFAEIAQLAGVDATDWSWSALLADFDLDGWKDIFITNGIARRPNDLDYLRYISNEAVQQNASDLELANHMPPGQVPNVAFRNTGGFFPLFENASRTWGLDLAGYSNGAAWADLDGDGDLDLVVNNLGATATLHRNRAVEKGKGNWLRIQLEGPTGNRYGIGAEVAVFSGGKMQCQQMITSRGWLSSVEPLLLFGLGSTQTIDSVRIHWPGGASQVIGPLTANYSLTLRYADASHPAEGQTSSSLVSQASLLLPPSSDAFQTLPTHREDRFTDFDMEALMPWMLSREGPPLAVADVDGDGSEDFYLGGAAGQPGQLWRSMPGGFRPIPVPDFDADKNFEDTGAVFFDADGDGDQDLYVVSGGGAVPEGHPRLQDRLYVNDGKGSFTRSESALPALARNGSCVVVGDFDGDGAIDLFVGSRSVPGSYGIPPRSALLRNNGKGIFEDATRQLCPACDSLGMVTAAAWLPAERLLAVAGEWMPLTFIPFNARRGGAATRLAHGLWQSLYAADLDGDGDTDLLAGNLGLNTDWKASSEEPMELFVADFDGNGATEPVISWFKDGRRHPVASKDDLQARMPPLKRQFVKYSDFAAASIEEIFGENRLSKSLRFKAEILESCWLENTPTGFVLHPLPREVQCAPVLAFATADLDSDQLPEIIAAGNRYEVQPYIGRFDASPGWLLHNAGQGVWQAMPPGSAGLYLPGQTRSLRWLRLGSGRRLLLIARNDAPVLVWDPTTLAHQ